MKTLILLLSFLLISACATKKAPEFKKEKVCSSVSNNYLKNPKNKTKSFLKSEKAMSEMGKTQPGMQLCYEALKARKGIEEFSACLVVGVDARSKLDFYEFSSNEKKLDNEFISCAIKATGVVNFSNLGKNYILIQSYDFYKE